MGAIVKEVSDNFSDIYGRWGLGGDKPAGMKNVTFIVTHRCNLRCSYCYEHNKEDRDMDLEIGKACIDYLFQMDREGHDYVNEEKAHGLILDFIGGEPLLKIGLIRELVDYFRDKAIRLGHRWATQYMISLTTNGLLYDDPVVQKFLAENEGRVSITVTIDGDKQTHDRCRVDCNGCGSYDRAIKAFRDIKERYGQDGSKFTIAPENVGLTYQACRHLIETGDLRVLHCNCVYEVGWTEEHAGVLYRQLKELADWMIEGERYRETFISIFDHKHGQPLPEDYTQNWCGGTGAMLAFDVDGTCYPCLRYAPLSVGDDVEPFVIGDCYTGIGVRKEDRERIRLLDAITRQSQSPEECLRCPIASGCGWCSAYNYEMTGTPDRRVTYICPTHKARVLATGYYLNSIYRKEGSRERYPLHCPREWAVPIVGEEEFEMLEALANE